MKETQEYLDALEIIRRYHKKEPVRTSPEIHHRFKKATRGSKIKCLHVKKGTVCITEGKVYRVEDVHMHYSNCGNSHVGTDVRITNDKGRPYWIRKHLSDRWQIVSKPKECDVCGSKRLLHSKRNEKLYCLDCKHSKPF